jgi:alginate O-acetyltransferase complex protein AlgI
MNFNSLRYLIFLPVMILLHWLVPSRYRWIPLLIGSYYFYACFQWYFCFLMLGMTLLSYLAGILTEKTDSPKKKKAILLTALVLCLSLLFVFKYLSFTVNAVISLADLLGARQDSLVLGILLPAGISFYTFQAISYVVDVGKGKFPAEHHFGYFALYLSFFPQLVAGPIERPGDLLPQLRAERKPVLSDFTEGFRYLLLGFFKKAVIADLLAPFVEKVYSSPATMNGEAVFLGTLFFAFQIYGDFAGYSDIALGSARMMGIRLSEKGR